MKKAVIITAVLLLIAGTGGSLWLKRRLDNQIRSIENLSKARTSQT